MSDDDCEPFPAGCPSPHMLDDVFLRATSESLKATLRRALHWVSYFRHEISSLPTESELPAAFREAYGRMDSLLGEVEQAITNGKEKCDAMEDDFQSSGLWWSETGDVKPCPALVEAAQEAVRQINQAEINLSRVVKSAKSALLNHAEQGLIDWSSPYECEFSILMNAGPTRRFYEICGEGDAEGDPRLLRVRQGLDPTLDLSFSDPTYNWNIFKEDDGHPLRDGHHGFLVYSLLDQLLIPWELLPDIREIIVQFEFSDFVTAWKAPTRQAPITVP